jgi:predicted nucleotidyltransferase
LPGAERFLSATIGTSASECFRNSLFSCIAFERGLGWVQKHACPIGLTDAARGTLQQDLDGRSASNASASLSIPKKGAIILDMGMNKTAFADALFSGLQRRVLGLLFGQPDRSFFGNELQRLTNAGRGALQRELEKLVSAELVTVTPIGNQKHYQANPSSPIFAELRGIVLKSVGMADVLRAALADVAGRIRVAFVYGSVAKGTDTALSDIDLMVVAENLGYTDLFEGLAVADAKLGRKVNPTLYTPEELAAKIGSENNFVLRVLEQPKIFVIGGEGELPSR